MRYLSLVFLLSIACQPDTTAGDEGDCGIAGCPDTGTDTGTEADGEALYSNHCASCHGADGQGLDDAGPDIVHELHHNDAKLIDVILNGDGDMEPVDVTEAQAQLIVDYMRAAWE